MSFVCTLSNDSCVAIHVHHLGHWIHVRLVDKSGHGLSTRPQHVSHMWTGLIAAQKPAVLTLQCGLFTPSVDSRLYSMTAWCCESSCDKSSPSEPCSLILRLHCFIDLTFYFIFSLILHCFLLNFLLFLLCKLITPAPVTLWHDTPTLKLSFAFVVMTMYSFNLILDLCLLGHSILLFTATAQLRPSSSSPHFSQTLTKLRTSQSFNFSSSSHAHQNCVSPDCSFVSHSNLLTITDSLLCLLLALLFCLQLALPFFYGFLGSDPGCFCSRRILGFRPWLFFSFFLGHHSKLCNTNFCRTRFVTTLDMHCPLSKFSTTLDTR